MLPSLNKYLTKSFGRPRGHAGLHGDFHKISFMLSFVFPWYPLWPKTGHEVHGGFHKVHGALYRECGDSFKKPSSVSFVFPTCPSCPKTGNGVHGGSHKVHGALYGERGDSFKKPSFMSFVFPSTLRVQKFVNS